MASIKAITATIDQAGLNPRKHRRAVETAVGVTAVYALKKYEGFTKRWKKKPRFTIRQSGVEAEVKTDDAVFGYQDRGTKGPYTIVPKRKKALMGEGLPHPVKRVRHPGLKAQKFTEQVQEAVDKYFPDEMERQIAAVSAKQ